MTRIYTDAAVSGNPGFAGVGILVLDNKEQKQIAFPLKGNHWNNHQAEFKAVSLGLSWLIEHEKTESMLFCYTDSQIVAQAVEKKYVKDKNFQKYLKEILHLMEHFSYASITWLPEAENRGADNLAKQALQEALNN